MNKSSTQIKLSGQLRELPERLNTQRPTMREIVSALHDSAIAMILLVFSVPAIVPTPGIPAGMLFGTALIFIGLQMVLGTKRIRLPAGLSRVRIAHAHLKRAVDRVLPILEKLEKNLRPRVDGFSTPFATRGIGIVVLLMAILITLPIPFGNTLPGLAVLLMALGLSQHDGWLILAGFALALLATIAAWLLLDGSWWLIETYLLGYFDRKS